MRQRILARLQELEPLVEEYDELKQIAGEMGLELPTESGRSSAQGRARTTGAGRRRNAPAPETAAQRGGARGRADGGGPAAGARRAAAERVLEAVRAQPGKTVRDYAEILGVPATAIYRPVRELRDDGALVKRARRLFPA